MTFRSRKLNSNTELARYYLKNNARRFILFYRFGANEVKLNNYLIEKYKMPLIQACLVILQKSTISTNLVDDELIITFKDKDIDKLATLITYGNGALQGSKILRYAFITK